jgi:ataxia telangiectasia mutated family protein
VDGFGPSGVEGVFRRSCERSVRVLREHTAAVLTVLEVGGAPGDQTLVQVLVHDPLYNWSVGPSKAAARQDAGRWEELRREEADQVQDSVECSVGTQCTVQGNRMASRALLVLSAKLEGREEGAGLSVEGQVAAAAQK